MSQQPSAGHNSGEVNGGQLLSFVERIERLNEEKKALGEDLKEIYAEAKAHGFDTKIMRKVVALRAMDADKRVEQEALVALYMDALGQLADTPLGQAAIGRMKARA